MKKKLTLLIDAQSLLKISFHGNKTSYDANGNHIGGLYTALTIIRKLIIEQSPQRVIMMWDGEGSGKLRYDIYPIYKANRDKSYNGIEFQEVNLTKHQEKESINRQRERLIQYCEELYIRQAADLYTEGDDLIGYYCTHLKEPNEEILIYSNDRDYTILLDEDISLYVANKHMIINSNSFFLFSDFHYKNTALVKAIEGCSSDNIAGFKSIGEKTLLEHFPEIIKRPVTFEEIYEKAKAINDARGKKRLKNLDNIINGVMKKDIMLDINDPFELFNLNYKLVNLLEPFITDDAIEILEEIKELPLDDTDRGSKNLLRMMQEDGFLELIPNKRDGFVDYILPFNKVVKEEKLLLEIYKINNKLN